MKLLCRLFGHRQPDPNFHGIVVGHWIAENNTEHANVETICDRCRTDYVLCKIALPRRQEEKRLQRRLDRIKGEFAA